MILRGGLHCSLSSHTLTVFVDFSSAFGTNFLTSIYTELCREICRWHSFIWRANAAEWCTKNGWLLNATSQLSQDRLWPSHTPSLVQKKASPAKFSHREAFLSSWTHHLPTQLGRCPGPEVYRAAVILVNWGACAEPRGYYNMTPSFSYNLFTPLPSGEHTDLTSVEPPDCRAAVFRMENFSLHAVEMFHPLVYLCLVSDLAIFYTNLLYKMMNRTRCIIT